MLIGAHLEIVPSVTRKDMQVVVPHLLVGTRLVVLPG